MARRAQELGCSDFEMTTKPAQLERQYEASLRVSMRLLDAEKARVHCIERLFLEFENSELRSQLNQTRDEVLGTSETEHETRLYLHSACKEVDRLQASSHTSYELHEEIVTLRAAAAENDKLLAEKTRLSNHITSLQSEFEQLKAQTASVRTVLSEKQDLQRQLGTLGEQLEKERHRCEQMRRIQSDQAEGISNLNARLREANKKLSEEMESRKRLERSMQQQTGEGQRSSLKTKLETFEQEPTARTERVESVRSQSERDRAIVDQHSPPTLRGSHNSVAIATPGAMEGRSQVQRATALPGDKSAFSITPFLSRANATGGSPSCSEEELDELHLVNEAESPSFKEKVSDDARNSGRTLEKKPASATAIPGPQSKHDIESRKSQNHSVAADLSTGKKSNRYVDDAHGQSDTALRGRQLSRTFAPRGKKRTYETEPGSELVGGETDTGGGVKKSGRKFALGGRQGFEQPGISGSNRLARFPRSRAFAGFADFSPLKRNRR